MALKECPECKHMVSSKAETCPNCGAPVKSFSLFWFIMKMIGWIVFGVLMLAWKILTAEQKNKTSNKNQNKWY